MILYGSSFSPFVRKVMVVAAEKGLDIAVRNTRLGDTDPDFLRASPFGKMPGFKDGDFLISDSTAIITYLEAVKPDPNLIPLEPKARARTIWYEEFADTIIGACVGKVFFNRIVAPKFMRREGDAKAIEEGVSVDFPKLVDYLETAIPASGFLVEDRLTLADIAVASPFVNLAHASCPVNDGSHPKTAAYLAKILARPSFAGWVAKEKAMLGAA